MPVNGHTFKLDPESGYMVPEKREGVKSFDVQAKKTFLKLYEEHADQGKVCDLLGISTRTLYDHLEHDSGFRADLALTLRRMEQSLSGTMFQKGKERGGYMYMITWLRKNFPEWNPKATIAVTSDTQSIDALFISLQEQGKMLDVTDGTSDASKNV